MTYQCCYLGPTADSDIDDILVLLSTADSGIDDMLVLLSTADNGIYDTLSTADSTSGIVTTIL